jgi:DNA-binding Xre family transcriptional regulator
MYSYNKLWKRMIDIGMDRKTLGEKAHISATTLTRMKQGRPISYDVCRRICEVIDCSPDEVVEFVED